MSAKSNTPPLYLGEFELLVLLAILRLDHDAYGVTIRDALERDTSREVALGAIYKTLGADVTTANLTNVRDFEFDGTNWMQVSATLGI